MHAAQTIYSLYLSFDTSPGICWYSQASLHKTQKPVNRSIYDRNNFIVYIQVLSQTLCQVTNDTPLSTYSVDVQQINFNEAVCYTNVNCFYCNLLLNLTQIPIT